MKLFTGPHEIETGTNPIGVLAVSPFREDHDTLTKMLPACTWTLYKAPDLCSTISQLNTATTIPLILCERDLRPGSWKDLITHIKSSGEPLLLIVASRFADEQLWAEALNIGAYDVLAKPFNKAELNRTLSLAWAHWQKKFEIVPKAFSIATGM